MSHNKNTQCEPEHLQHQQQQRQQDTISGNTTSTSIPVNKANASSTSNNNNSNVNESFTDSSILSQNLNAVILQYLESCGLEDSYSTFCKECENKGVPLPKDLPQPCFPALNFSQLDANKLLEYFDSENGQKLIESWTKFCSELDPTEKDSANTITFYLHIYLALIPYRQNGSDVEKADGIDRLSQFFHEFKSRGICSDNSMFTLFALPFVPDPMNTEPFNELFLDPWKEKLRAQVSGALTHHFRNFPHTTAGSQSELSQMFISYIQLDSDDEEGEEEEDEDENENLMSISQVNLDETAGGVAQQKKKEAIAAQLTQLEGQYKELLLSYNGVQESYRNSCSTNHKLNRELQEAKNKLYEVQDRYFKLIKATSEVVVSLELAVQGKFQNIEELRERLCRVFPDLFSEHFNKANTSHEKNEAQPLKNEIIFMDNLEQQKSPYVSQSSSDSDDRNKCRLSRLGYAEKQNKVQQHEQSPSTHHSHRPKRQANYQNEESPMKLKNRDSDPHLYQEKTHTKQEQQFVKRSSNQNTPLATSQSTQQNQSNHCQLSQQQQTKNRSAHTQRHNQNVVIPTESLQTFVMEDQSQTSISNKKLSKPKKNSNNPNSHHSKTPGTNIQHQPQFQQDHPTIDSITFRADNPHNSIPSKRDSGLRTETRTLMPNEILMGAQHQFLDKHTQKVLRRSNSSVAKSCQNQEKPLYKNHEDVHESSNNEMSKQRRKWVEKGSVSCPSEIPIATKYKTSPRSLPKKLGGGPQNPISAGGTGGARSRGGPHRTRDGQNFGMSFPRPPNVNVQQQAAKTKAGSILGGIHKITTVNRNSSTNSRP